MNTRSKYLLLLASMLLGLHTQACGIVRYNVQGRVVDAVTEKPIKEAAVVIHWYSHDLIPFPPGLDSGTSSIGTFEALSDEEGYFEVPKYVLQMYNMGVYKKGYIGWYNEFIFSKDFKKPFKDREDFEVESGMEIQLEPIESLIASESYTLEEVKANHACFVNSIPTYCETSGGDIFVDAIIDESKLCWKYRGSFIRKKATTAISKLEKANNLKLVHKDIKLWLQVEAPANEIKSDCFWIFIENTSETKTYMIEDVYFYWLRSKFPFIQTDGKTIKTIKPGEIRYAYVSNKRLDEFLLEQRHLNDSFRGYGTNIRILRGDGYLARGGTFIPNKKLNEFLSEKKYSNRGNGCIVLKDGIVICTKKY